MNEPETACFKVKLLHQQESIAGPILQALSAANEEIYLVRCGEGQKIGRNLWARRNDVAAGAVGHRQPEEKSAPC
jgi:hypothetical protein